MTDAKVTIQVVAIPANYRYRSELLRGDLHMWCVYDHPLDFPDYFVAREFRWDKPTESTIQSKELLMVREQLKQMGLVPMQRDPNDDPVIIEIWI